MAGKVTTDLAESNGSVLPGGWLEVTCGLTAFTPGSAPGPTLGNEHTEELYLLVRTKSGCCVMLEFHDADNDTDMDILARTLADTSDTRDFLKLFLWKAERHADILATILARMSARKSVSVSVSASWNGSLTHTNATLAAAVANASTTTRTNKNSVFHAGLASVPSIILYCHVYRHPSSRDQRRQGRGQGGG